MSVLAMDDVTEGSSLSGATSRHKLVFGRSVRTITMMQSCASAAKLRGGGPILNRGSKTIVLNRGSKTLVLYRVAATSVRQLQFAINRRATAGTQFRLPSNSLSGSRTKEQTCWCLAGGD